MAYKQTYNLNKTLEAALYICNKLGKVGKHQLNKLFYFADKYHLQRYGRTITGDEYKKLKYGPVANTTYQHIGFSSFIHDTFTIKGNYITGKREPNIDELSDSDLEALQFSIEEYGDLSFSELVHESHDETWRSAKMKEIFSLDQFLLTYDDDTREEIKDYLEDC